jgi:hypothetical protein
MEVTSLDAGKKITGRSVNQEYLGSVYLPSIRLMKGMSELPVHVSFGAFALLVAGNDGLLWGIWLLVPIFRDRHF